MHNAEMVRYVHVELEHCVIRCSWHTQEDTTTSAQEDEYGGMTHITRKCTKHTQNTKLEMIQIMRYLQRWAF